MFDLIFDGLSAWNQLLLIFGGLILLAIGGAILGDFVYWRLKAQRVKGKIVGVRAQISKFNKEEQKKEDPPEEELTSFAEEFKKSPGTGIIAVIFIVMMIGIPSAFICIGTYFAYDYFALKASGVSVEAIVTGQDESYDSESGTTYHALLRFTDEYGRQHNVRDRMGGGKPSYKINEKVIIYYERGDPEHFVTTDFWHNMILPVGFVGMGSLFLILIFSGAFQSKDKKKKAKPSQSYQSEMYYPVFEYTMRNGQTYRSEGQTGSNWISDKIPGKRVKLLVDPKDPENVRRPSLLFLILGLCFFIPGCVMIYSACKNFEFNFISLIMALGLIGFIVIKIKTRLESSVGEITTDRVKKEFKKSFKEKRKKGRLLTAEEFKDRLRYWDRTTRYWLPVMGIIAACMIAGGYYWGKNHSEFSNNALNTTGTVIDVVSEYNSSSDGSSYTYYPVVSFETQGGKTYKFKDNVGSNPPSYSGGETVSVLYDPEDPDDAIIDRGLLNWIPMIALMLFGFLLLVHTISLAIAIEGRLGRV